MKKLIILFLGVLMGAGAMAQQEPHYTFFMFNRQNLNPAFVGSSGGTDFQFLSRKQWVQIEGAPSTFAAGVSTLLGKGATRPKSALGLSFYSDRIGMYSNNYVGLQYAYHAQLSQNTILSFGVQGALRGFDRDFSQLNADQSNDPALQGGNTSSYTGNLGAGLFLYSSKMYVGLGIPNVLRTAFSSGEEAQVVRHAYAMAGYRFDLSKSFALRPGILVKSTLDGSVKTIPSYDVNLSAIWNDRFLLGVSYRWDESLGFMTKLMLGDKIYVGYAYDLGLQGIAYQSNGSHEVMLGVHWGLKTKGINNPRFINYF